MRAHVYVLLVHCYPFAFSESPPHALRVTRTSFEFKMLDAMCALGFLCVHVCMCVYVERAHGINTAKSGMHGCMAHFKSLATMGIQHESEDQLVKTCPK